MLIISTQNLWICWAFLILKCLKFGKKTICLVEKASELHKINKVLNFKYWNKNNYWCLFFYKEYVPSLRAVHMYQPSSANSVERISRLLLVRVNTRGDVVIGSKFEDSLFPKKKYTMVENNKTCCPYTPIQYMYLNMLITGSCWVLWHFSCQLKTWKFNSYFLTTTNA